MSDQEETTVDQDLQALTKKVMDVENRYYQQVTITRLKGDCPYDHAEGDTFQVTNINHDCMCGGLYKAIHPSISTLHYGGSVPWEGSPDSFRGICPEMKVEVKGQRIETGDLSTVFKTRTDMKTMTGKGFHAVDQYRAFVEVRDIQGFCGWGHKQGDLLEIDPFNAGQVCGMLYAKLYEYLNLYFSGAEFPWEEDNSHILHSSCPDPYNMVSFRLIMKNR